MWGIATDVYKFYPAQHFIRKFEISVELSIQDYNTHTNDCNFQTFKIEHIFLHRLASDDLPRATTCIMYYVVAWGFPRGQIGVHPWFFKVYRVLLLQLYMHRDALNIVGGTVSCNNWANGSIRNLRRLPTELVIESSKNAAGRFPNRIIVFHKAQIEKCIALIPF